MLHRGLFALVTGAIALSTIVWCASARADEREGLDEPVIKSVAGMAQAEALLVTGAMRCPPGWTSKVTNRNHPQGCFFEYTYPPQPPTNTKAICTEIGPRFLGFCLAPEIITIFRDPNDDRFDPILLQSIMGE